MWVTNTVQQKFFNRLLSRPQNIKCADCGSKSPSWASIDFGVLVCLNCSGAHRALGPSVTRVKSTKLDTWMSDWFEYMTCGNEACNLYWEGNIGLNRKPNSNSTLDQIKKFVQEKYLKRKFVLPGHKDPITLMREGAVVQVEPKAAVLPKSPKKSNSDEIEKASQQSNPDDNNLLDFDDEPTSKPSGDSITSAKQTKKLQVDLMDFTSEPAPALKKSHSVEPIHHLSNQLYQTPVLHIQNQHSYQQQHHPYYTHAHQPVVHNNFHFGHFGQPQPQLQHQPTNLMTYGQSGLSANLQHNPNVGYMMHANNFQSAPQPISMNMNINMYANNINLNIHPEPMLKMTDPEKKDKKKEDAFAGFDEFKL